MNQPKVKFDNRVYPVESIYWVKGKVDHFYFDGETYFVDWIRNGTIACRTIDDDGIYTEHTMQLVEED